MAEPLTVGNSAKLYCLRWIERLIATRPQPVRILDLGCGRALNFVELLRRHPQTRYVGIEPLVPETRIARENLRGFDALVLEGDAYDAHERLAERFDVVVSFSVLEHVYRRDAYLRAAAESLAAGGRVLINYDCGHFRTPTARDRIKNLAGPWLARMGREHHYQRFVREEAFSDLVRRAGLRIVEGRVFNSHLKDLYHAVPGSARGEFMERWLELELWLNDVLPPYEDQDSERFYTRNFILERALG
jgi:SAM-dependent methyltransferase